MNSISRAVTSRFNDISNKRQRLGGEGKDTDFVNPTWTDPTTSKFNCFEPPELIISEEDIHEIPTIGLQVEQPKQFAEVKAPNNISRKVTSVVRRLSPFGSSSNLSKEKDDEKHDANDEKKSQRIFKETMNRGVLGSEGIGQRRFRSAGRESVLQCITDVCIGWRGKMDRIKKSFKTNERQQLIDSDEEQ